MNKYIYFAEIFFGLFSIYDIGIKPIAVYKIIFFIIFEGTMYAAGVFFLISKLNDFNEFAESLSLLLVGIPGFVKYYILVYNRKKILKLRDIVNSNGVRGQELKNENSIIDYYDQVGLRFAKIYQWTGYVVGLGIVLQTMPGVFLGDGLRLVYPAIYPFSLNSTTAFTMVYLHQSIGTSMFVLSYLVSDIWFIFLVHHACGHFCLLQSFLEKIGTTDQDSLQIHETIVKCVRLHQNIYKFTDEIEDVFCTNNLLQFLISTLVMCVSGYKIVFVGFDDPQILVKHISVVCGEMQLMFIFNWCGNIIEEKSFGVSEAILRSNFYKLEVVHQRDLGLILLRAQKPAYITAGKFSNLSLLTFSNLLQTSMSYLTVLISIVQEN